MKEGRGVYGRRSEQLPVRALHRPTTEILGRNYRDLATSFGVCLHLLGHEDPHNLVRWIGPKAGNYENPQFGITSGEQGT